MIPLRDEFLSDEDLDLRSMTEDELYAYWDLWLRQAQATNDQDGHAYSHGVFTVTPDAPGSGHSRSASARTSASSSPHPPISRPGDCA